MSRFCLMHAAKDSLHIAKSKATFLSSVGSDREGRGGRTRGPYRSSEFSIKVRDVSKETTFDSQMTEGSEQK